MNETKIFIAYYHERHQFNYGLEQNSEGIYFNPVQYFNKTEEEIIKQHKELTEVWYQEDDTISAEISEFVHISHFNSDLIRVKEYTFKDMYLGFTLLTELSLREDPVKLLILCSNELFKKFPEEFV